MQKEPDFNAAAYALGCSLEELEAILLRSSKFASVSGAHGLTTIEVLYGGANLTVRTPTGVQHYSVNHGDVIHVSHAPLFTLEA